MTQPVEQTPTTSPKWANVSTLLTTLYETVDQLEGMFPGRKFTPDWHLVGSIGEVIAAYMFDLSLFSNSYAGHDAESQDGTLVQIKFTQGNRAAAIRSEPVHLIVLRLTHERDVEIVYNGPGSQPWNTAGKRQSNGQRCMNLSRLRKLNASVAVSAQLPLINTLDLKDSPHER
ncbi:MAG: hypothetical protein WD005_02830 [Haliea sp.]